MATGKHLSLEEARKANQLERFAKESPSQEMYPGRFSGLLDKMINNADKKNADNEEE